MNDKQKQLENNEDRSLLWCRFIVPALFPQIRPCAVSACSCSVQFFLPKYSPRDVLFEYHQAVVHFCWADRPVRY